MFGNNDKKARAAIERTYTDTCDIYKSKEVDGIVQKEVSYRAIAGLKCALSQRSLRATGQTETTNNIQYDAKLFCAPENEIPAGCEIRVFAQGRELRFITSGEPFVYETHQEIMLLRRDKA
jgi:hypothetical protein